MFRSITKITCFNLCVTVCTCTCEVHVLVFVYDYVIYNTIGCMYMYMLHLCHLVCVSISGETGEIYDAPPTRPMNITHMYKHSCDIAIDDNTAV